MSKKLEDVREILPKRASRITEAEMIFIANHRIRPDIKDDYYTTFEADAMATKEITILAATYSYNLPVDFFEPFVQKGRQSPVVDADGSPLRKVYTDIYRADNSGFGGRTYWINSGSINFPKYSIDNSIITVGEKIYLTYLKMIPDITAESNDLPFGDRLQELMFPIYVSGIPYFFFTGTKKLVDRQLQLSDYKTAKANTFSISI